jgi:O-antigen ligase
MIFWLSLVVIVASVFLGGGTASGFLGDVITQLLAVPLFVVAARHWLTGIAHQPDWRATDYLLCMSLAGLTLILVVQLAPWPAAVVSTWENSVPNFNSSTIASIMDARASWQGLSTTPHASWATAVSLLPSLAVFFGVIQLDARARLKLAGVMSILGALSLLLGFVQVVQGPGSELRFYEITNPSEAVGFFANRNHFAALLYTTLIFSSVCLTFAASRFVAEGKVSSRSILWLALSGALIISILAGIAIARSRAGVILSAVALVGIIVIIFADHQPAHRSRAKYYSGPHLALIMILLAIGFTVQFGLHRVMTRFETDPLQDLRWALSPATFEIALDYLPLGSGLGSFVEVYANHEKTANLFNGFANRAHNDWAEIFLETGVLGAATITIVLVWFVIRAVQIARLRVAIHGNNNYLLLQRSAVLVIVLLLAHSFVDYPLRTTAMSVIFLFTCALLVDPPTALQRQFPNLEKR